MSDPDVILAEAVADNIGFAGALPAALKKEDFSAEKFFVVAAKNFGGQMSRRSALQYSETDTHPVARVRINALFRNLSKFCEVFGKRKGVISIFSQNHAPSYFERIPFFLYPFLSISFH